MASFNLSATLVKKLNIERDVQYFKDSTLIGLTGINPDIGEDDLTSEKKP